MNAERWHDRLPWYVSGTLGETESRQFAEHLGGCDACRKELSVLESMKRELEAYGDDLLRDHPPPEKLVALIEGGEEPLSAEEAAEVRRHLAICATCTEESSWLRGEAVAGIASSVGVTARGGAATRQDATIVEMRRSSFSPSRAWLAAAALAAVTLIAVLLVVKSGRAPEPALIARYQFVPATHRTSQPPPTVAVEAGETTVRIVLEPEIPAAGFPLTLEIQGSDGRTELRRDGIRAEDLSGGQLYLAIPRRVLPDGEHVLRLGSAGGAAEPLEEFPFKLETRARP